MGVVSRTILGACHHQDGTIYGGCLSKASQAFEPSGKKDLAPLEFCGGGLVLLQGLVFHRGQKCGPVAPPGHN